MLVGLWITFITATVLFWSLARAQANMPYGKMSGINKQFSIASISVAGPAPLIVLALFFSTTVDFKLFPAQFDHAFAVPLIVSTVGGWVGAHLILSYSASFFARIFAGLIVLFFTAIAIATYAMLIGSFPNTSSAGLFLCTYGLALMTGYLVLFEPRPSWPAFGKGIAASAIFTALAFALSTTTNMPHPSSLEFIGFDTAVILIAAFALCIPGLITSYPAEASAPKRLNSDASVDDFPGCHTLIATTDGTVEFISRELQVLLPTFDLRNDRISLIDILKPDDWPSETFQAALQSGDFNEIEQREFNIETRKGTIESAPIRVQHANDTSPDKRRLYVTVLMGHRNKEIEGQYANLKANVRFCLDAIPDVLFFVDANGSIQDLNKAALDNLRRSKRECLGERFWSLFTLTDNSPSPTTWLSALKAAEQDGTINVQTEFICDKQTRTFAFSFQKLNNQLPATPLFLCVGNDITEEVEIRTSFSNAQARLEKDIAARTKELREAKFAADTASDTKSRFLANMSHELRTPLNAIIGYTELILLDFADSTDADVDPQQQEDLNRIKLNATHLLALINDILDIAKVEADKMEIVRSEVIANSFFSEIEAIVDPLIAKNDNTLGIKNNIGGGLIFIDKQKVKQCLLNLVSNAAKFTREGKIELEAGTVNDGDRKYLVVKISDTGSGMTKQQCTAVFEEFIQVSEGEDQISTGTGLGLPIAKKFAQAMGGDLTVESQPGEGSTFTLTVLLNDDALARNANATA